ncbi:MAG TPA: tetratricopeptide repeat protein, partial [Gemmatimonadales bacterium]|nr:tetratricopeptide repeat protein [Gemmatimonadales bacterium]
MLTATSLVRDDPDSARRAIESLLALAARADADSANVLLSTAMHIAESFAESWGDSVPGRTVAWFRAAGHDSRVGKAAADSLRRSGGTALRAEGLQPALRLWRASLDEARGVGDTVGLVAATVNIGVAFYTAGELDSATAWLEPAYRRALAIADYRAAGTALGTLASIRKDREEYRAAAELYQRAAELQDRVGDTRGLAAAHNNLGLVAAAVGDTTRAREAYERALDLNRRFKRPAAAAANLVNLGTLADLQGNYGRAVRLYREALDAYVAAGDSLSTGLALQNLGRLELRRGNYRTAVASLTRALAIHRRIGPAAAAHSVAIDLSRAHAATGAVQAAARVLDRAEQLETSGGLAEGDRASLALARAELEARLNRVEAADRYLAAAERYFEAAGDPASQADAREERALMDLRRGRHRAALGHLRQALRVRELAGDVRASAGTRLLLGFAAGELGDTAEARRAYDESRTTFARVGDPAGEAEALGALGQLALLEGLPLSADSLYAAALDRLKRRPAPPLAWRLHLGRAEALRGSRATGAAARELQAAIAEIERFAGAFALPEIRSAFMADKWTPYAELAQLE